MEFRAEQVSLLRKQALRVGGPFIAVRIGDSEAHIARLGFDAQMLKKGNQVRVIGGIIDDEADIDVD